MEAVSELSDAQLVVGVAQFKEPCLAEIYRRHGGAIFGLARRVLGQPSLAEDVVQEVFLALWSKPEKFDAARGSLRSYLLALTHGRAVDVVRALAARQRREQREAATTANAGYDLEREVWDLSVQDHVAAALATLPEDERKPIELAYFGGHTYRDVAVMLGAPEGTVKSRIRSGLRRLQVALADADLSEHDTGATMPPSAPSGTAADTASDTASDTERAERP